MTHLDEGTIVALRDGALVDGDHGAHLSGCATCQAALSEARGREASIARALREIDEPVRTDAAKSAVRARLDRERDRPASGWRFAGPLGRAAAILLVCAGAAYAVPGSPLRDWIGPAEDGAPPSVPTTALSGQEAAHTGGIEVEVPDGRIAVVLSGVADGSTVDVVWVDASRARIEAPAGSTFSFGEGRAEATVAAGPVRVELPRAAVVVSVVIDGVVYLRRAAAGLEVLEAAEQQSDARIRFVVPAR